MAPGQSDYFTEYFDYDGTVSGMDTPKRPASAIGDGNLREPIAKQIKVEHGDSSHTESTPENDFATMPSMGIHDTVMPDFDSTANRHSMLNSILDNNHGTLQLNQQGLTWGVQTALGNLRSLSAEETTTILESMIRQMAPVLPGNSAMTALNPVIPNSINQAGMQSDEANLRFPMSHSSGLNGTKELIEKLKTTIEEQSATIKGLDAKTKEQDATIQEQNATIKEQDATIKEQDATIEEQHATIEEKDNTIEMMETATPQGSHISDSELSGPKQQASLGWFSATIVDDDMIRKKFLTLSSSINSSVNTYFRGDPHKAPTKNDQKALFDRLTTNWTKKYLKNGKRKQYFMKAAIWTKIIDKILKHPLVIWSPQMGNDLPEFHKSSLSSENHSEQQLQIYHYMRAGMAESLQLLCGRNGHYFGTDPKPTENRTQFAKELAEFFDLFANMHGLEVHVPHFLRIIDAAVDLAKLMAAARVDYAVRMSNGRYVDTLYGFQFMPTSMKTVDDSSPGLGIVDLVSTPAFIKRGNSDGVGYKEKPMVLVYAQVITREPVKKETGKLTG
ncbi:hypothetical protein PG991_010906 [Apiospora marii]|uniref:Uncharacterized protein n=1 Tax=Apiospora marii TaxID=335849 RepID=A0ABR1RCY1_9PEZI